MKHHDSMSFCSTCYHAISKADNICSSCGVRLNTGKRGPGGLLALLSFWIFNFAMAASFWSSNAVSAGSGVNGTHKISLLAEGMWPFLALWLFGAVLLGALAYWTRPIPSA